MLKFPFIQHTSVGIHITQSKIYWVEARRLVDSVRITSVDEEMINDTLQQAIKNLSSRHDLSYPFISVNIPLADLTYRLVNAPQVEDEDIFESWLNNQYTDILPETASWDKYTIKHQLLSHSEDSATCFFAMVDNNVVTHLKNTFESAGLHPICIGTGILEMGYGLILSEDFVNGKSHILKEFEQESFFTSYHNGLLEEISYLDPDDDSLLPAIAGNLTEGKNVFREQDSASQAVYRISQSQQINSTRQINTEHDRAQNLNVTPAANATSFTGVAVPNSHMVALGLSMKQLYPDLDEVNFVDPSKISYYRRQTEKKDLIHLSTGLAGLAIALLIISLSFNLFTDYRLSTVEIIAGNMTGQISAVEAAAEELQSDKLQAMQIQELIQDRNYFAPVLELIGRNVPEKIWLSNITIAGNPDNRIDISGFSMAEVEISRFMELLEQTEQIESVQLQHSQRGSAGDFLDDYQNSEHPLFQFDLNLRYASVGTQ